jgi:hypothetical protein
VSRNRYPHETSEWAAVTVTVNDVVVTASVEFAILPVGSTAAKTWTAAVIRDTKTGVNITGLTVGFYEVSARVTDAPDLVVIDCGTFEMT